MTFETKRLMGARVLVTGTDSLGTDGKTVLDATQWDEVMSHQKYDQATEAFETAVKDFFAPLIEAADAVKNQVKAPEDPMSYVVLHEAVETVPGTCQQLIRLTRDSIILRMIEDGKTDRLVWVEDQLEVLEAEKTALENSAEILENPMVTTE